MTDTTSPSLDSRSVLLCHGFTSTPASMKVWADGLREAGHDVVVPRLPGHGTTWQELNRTGWQDWYATVERCLLQASQEEPIFVGGLSMGGALALRLAQRHPERVAGLMLVNPAVLLQDRRLVALPVLRRFVGSLPGIASDIAKPGVHEEAYDRTPLNALASSLELFATVEAELPSIRPPLIVFRSLNDHVVPVASPLRVLARVSSVDVTDCCLQESFHVATLDHEADLIVNESLAFIARIAQQQTVNPQGAAR